MADFLEKIPNRLPIRASCTEKEQRGHWKRNPVRTDKTINQVLGVQCEDGIFRNNRDLWKAKNFLRTEISPLCSEGIMQSD